MKGTMGNTLGATEIATMEKVALVGSWYWDLRSHTGSWSDECYSICGLPPGDKRLNSETVLNFIHPDDREGAKKAIKFAVDNRQPYAYEKRFIRLDGSVRFIVASGIATYNSMGEPLTMYGTIHDITNLKETEILLAKEKRTLKQYLNAAASILLIIKRDHTIELINKKGCEVLGYSRDEIIGKNWFCCCIPKKEKKELIQVFDEVIAGSLTPPDVYENWVVAKGNKRKLIRWRNALLRDENDKITGVISSGFDVTAQVAAEQKLRDSEEKNRAILEAIPDVITIHDKNGTIVEIHMPNEEYLNVRKQELEGKNISDLLPKKVGVKLKKVMTKVIHKQQMETLEVNVPVADGTIDYECRLVPVNDSQVLTIARNITKTKGIKNTLHLRNKALEFAGNGIVIVDAQQPDLPILYSNGAFTRMTGYRQSEILGKNCRFLQNDDRDQESIKTMARAIQNGKSCRVVLRNYRKDGTLFWNELTITPLYDESQKLTHFIGMQNDVTEIQNAKKELQAYADKLETKVVERTKEIEATFQKLVQTNLNLEDQIQVTKLAENKAQRSQALFAAIAKNFPKGLIVVFNTDFELVYVEGEELKRFNLKKTDFEGNSVSNIPFFSEVQMERIKQDVLKTVKGESLSFEIEFKNNHYAVNSTPLKSDGEGVIWALFVYNNITEQKIVRDELTKALASEQELNELKSRFISMASHEFRTPLSAILSSAILIGKQNEPGKEERRAKHVSRIRTHVKHLVVILNDFLSLSKLEEGRVQAKPQDIELVQFCKIIVDEMEGTKKEGQAIKLKYSEVEIPVFLDPKLLHHILVNLLSNALKYSEEGQEIQLELEQIEDIMIFKVTDYGIGIPEQEQENLFERFFRAENVTNIQGTGLGLHIVKQYVELMKGAVTFISKTGEGSTFTVKLPLNLSEYEKNTIN